MKKTILSLALSGALFLLGSNVALASDFWVYSQDNYNYYVVEETLEPVKGAYHIDVKEVGPSGKPYKYKLGVYSGGNGSIMYYRAGRKPVETRQSNGHDLPAAVWQYAISHSNF